MKKLATIYIQAILLSVISGGLFAQSAPVSDTLQANSIRARVQSNGAFFLGGTNGEFLVPSTTSGVPEISLLKSAGLWLGGRDSAGVLHLAAQTYNEGGKADFYPGLLLKGAVPYPEFNFIADVTGADIAAHIANPAGQIPSVYAWPGWGNPYFFSYYGFDLPFTNFGSLAGFDDVTDDYTYNPNAGEYPTIALRACPLKYYADEQMWFSFHDAGPHTQSGGALMNMGVETQIFGINCPEGSPLDRAAYVIYKLTNYNDIPLDSCYFGVFMDFEIGNGADDFIGCDTARRVVFAYNGDDTDEGGFENTPPVLAVDLLRGPIHPDDPINFEVKEWHFVPVDDSNLDTPEAYYNQLAGRHPDGTPFPNNGLMYAGNPLNPAEWSETSAGNIPGERKALTSIGPFRLLPGAVNEIVLGYAWVRKDPNGSAADNLSILGATMDEVQEFFDYCFYLFEGCPGNVAAKSLPENLSITVSPNPFAGSIRVESGEIPMQAILLFDATGRLVREMKIGGSMTTTLQTGDLSTGLYLLQVRFGDGHSGIFKLIHE